MDSPSSPSTPRRSRAPGSSPSRCRCTPPCAWASSRRSAPRREPRRAHLLLRPLRHPQRRLPPRPAGADSVIGGECEALVACVAAEAGARSSGGGSRACCPSDELRGRRPPAAPARRAVDFPVPSAHALPAIKKYAHVERDGRRDLAGYVGGQPRLPAPLPALPDPAGLRRPLLRGPASRSVLADVRQQVAAGAEPRHLRRSRFPQRAAPRAGRGPRAARRVPARDVRLHRQGRAPAARARAPAGAGGAGLRCSSSPPRSRSSDGCSASRQGPHARRHRGGAARHPRGRHRAAAHLGGLHAVDDARRTIASVLDFLADRGR